MNPLVDLVGLPTGANERWKYTPVNELVSALSAAVLAAPAKATRAAVDEVAGDLGCPRVVFVNGYYAEDLSDGALPDGFDGARSALDSGLLVVEAGARITAPLHVVHLSTAGDTRSVSQPRTSIRVGARSNVAFVETYCGLPGPTFTDASTTLRVGPGAEVIHVRVQAESPEADHVGRTVVDQGEGSKARLTSVMIGADIARHETAVRLDAGARADLDGVSMPSRHQRHDNVVIVDHAASHATSTQQFRAAIDDHARSSFSGHVIVRGGTVGNDAQQTSRSLLLSRAAEADTRPWLEILADDVRCTHGATVGRLDERALFYLRSRGIALADSRAILVAAFVAEIIDTIEPASLRARLAARCALPMVGGHR